MEIGNGRESAFLVAFPPLERLMKFVAVDAEMNGYKNK